jgi:hypothetical protein
MADAATLRQNITDMLVRVAAGGDEEAAERLIHPDFVNHEADPERRDGPAGAVATGAWLRSCFGGLGYGVDHVLHLVRFADDGRALEHWAVRDDLGLAVQAGLLPAPQLDSAET